MYKYIMLLVFYIFLRVSQLYTFYNGGRFKCNDHYVVLSRNEPKKTNL